MIDFAIVACSGQTNVDYEIRLHSSFRVGGKIWPTAIKIQIMKRKSLVVAFGTYSAGGYDVRVVQITRASVRLWAWHGCTNPMTKDLRHLRLRQNRAKCVAETRELEQRYDAQFGGVRRLVFSHLADGIATKNNLSDYHVGEILELAQASLGGIRLAVKWLQSPSTELKGQRPIELTRTKRGRWRLEDLLTRLQFKQFENAPGSN